MLNLTYEYFVFDAPDCFTMATENELMINWVATAVKSLNDLFNKRA